MSPVISMSAITASTTRGSNCVPAHARSSATAAGTDRADRYGRSVVMALKASQQQMIRAISGICSPALRSG